MTFSPSRLLGASRRERLEAASIAALVDEAQSAEIRRRILAGVERIERAERNRSEVSRELEGALVEVWL